MKMTLLKGALLAMAFGMAVPASPSELIPVSGIVTGLASDGAKAVGVKGQFDSDRFASYLFDVKTKATEWLTKYDDSDLLTSGRMIGLSTDGVIAGTIKNPDMRLPYVDDGGFRPSTRAEEPLGEAINSAAVWREGKPYVLGCGPHDISEFDQTEDGSEAVAITADGKTVFGNIVHSLFKDRACKWTYDETTDSFEYDELEMGKGVTRTVINSASRNGVAAGFVRKNGIDMPAFWDTDGKLNTIDLPGGNIADYYWDINADAISPDGRYIVVHGMGNHMYLGIYDTATGELTEIKLPANTFEAFGNAVTNAGDAYISLTNDDNYTANLHYYNAKAAQLMVFDHYLENTNPGIAAEISSSNLSVAAVSDDASTLAVVSGDQYSVSSYILTLDSKELVAVTAPEKVRLFHSTPTELGLTWNGIASLPEGAELKGYDVYIDDEFAETVEASELGGSFRFTAPGEAGRSHSAYVVTSIAIDGDEYNSPNSLVTSTYVSSTTDIFGYDTFNDATIDSNGDPHPANDYWTVENPYGNPAHLILWHLSTNDYVNRTPFYATYAISDEPWSTQLCSRFHDASETDDFYLDFSTNMSLVNAPDQELGSDFLDVEASTDGFEWKLVKRIPAEEVHLGKWATHHIEMGEEWGGKCFRVRFNAHGEGEAMLLWKIDNISFSDELGGDIPTGLMATQNSDKGVELTWHNTIGTHEASYVANSPILYDYNLGNEGKPLTAAVMLTPEMMAPFTGKNISGVTSFIFDNPELTVDNPTRAEVMIMSDGEVLGRGDIYSEFNEVESTTGWLEQDVKIEEGKTYYACVRIYDYDPQQTPIYYQADESFIAGVTDLYSEDDGKTWRRVSQDLDGSQDAFAPMCIWPIRVQITDGNRPDPEETFDDSLTHYTVARNGEVISRENIYPASPRFTDSTPLAEAEYTVRAYFEDGTISEFSAPVRIDTSAITGVDAEVDAEIEQTGDVIAIRGKFDEAVVIDMTGRRVLTTHSAVIDTTALQTGIYIVTVAKDSGHASFKIVVR